MNMTADAPLLAADGVPLAVKLKRAERRKKLRAALLVAPLAVFLLATFILPIALLLYRSVENPEVPAMLPKTVSALAGWQGQGLPDEAALGVFAQELTAAKDNKAMVGNAAKRLNMEISGLPYSGSPASGCPAFCMCTRIWWVRPVSSLTRAWVCERKRSSTR